MQRPVLFASTLLVALAAMVDAAPAAAQATPPVPPVPASTTVAQLDLSFAPNAGRYPADVAFYTHALGGTIQVGVSGSSIILPPPQAPDQYHGRDPHLVRAPLPQRLGLQFLGANPATTIAPDSDAVGTLTVAVAGRAATALPTVTGITYQQLYPGIDLYYTGSNGDLKSTFTLAPQTNPDLLRWQYTGAATITIEPSSGDLLLTLPRPAGLPAAIPATVIRDPMPQPPGRRSTARAQRLPFALSCAMQPPWASRSTATIRPNR